MKTILWNDFLDRKAVLPGRISLTTGVFDGIHVGHQALLQKLTGRPGNSSVLSTFSKNPFKFFFPERYPGDIITLNQKKNLLEQFGVDYLLLIDFSLNFSKLSGGEFFQILKERIFLEHLVLGRNHRCGRRGDTGAEDVRRMFEPTGTSVDIVEPLVLEGHPVSSTRIREAILDGDVEKAHRLLGRYHSLNVNGVPFEKKGMDLCFRREDIQQILPKSGVYITLSGDGGTAVKAVLEIDDRILLLHMEKKLDVTRIDFLQQKRSEE